MDPGRKRGGAKGAKENHLNLGDFVLAKVKGFPAWPAKISRPADWQRAPDPLIIVDTQITSRFSPHSKIRPNSIRFLTIMEDSPDLSKDGEDFIKLPVSDIQPSEAFFQPSHFGVKEAQLNGETSVIDKTEHVQVTSTTMQVSHEVNDTRVIENNIPVLTENGSAAEDRINKRNGSPVLIRGNILYSSLVQNKYFLKEWLRYSPELHDIVLGILFRLVLSLGKSFLILIDITFILMNFLYVMVDGYCAEKRFDEAVDVFNSMVKFGFRNIW